MNAKAVGSDPKRRGLWGGIYKRFGSFEAAIEALGAEYDEIRQVTAWSGEKVLDGLKARLQKELPMNYKAVRRADERLAEAAARWFGTYDEALRAADLDPATIRKQRVWSKELILAELGKRVRKGLPMNHGAVSKDNLPLCMAASFHFGSFGKAIEALGLKYEDVRQHCSWNRLRIIRAIRGRARKGLPLNANAVQRDGTALTSAATFWFGSYEKAVRAAGFDYQRIRLVHVWTKSDVLQGIRRRARYGKTLNHAAVDKDEAPLAAHARVLFGSWENALKKVGIDPVGIRKWKRWSREEVIRFIRGYAREGVPVTQAAIFAQDRRLPAAAAAQFGSWSAAVRAAGFIPGRFGVGRLGWISASRGPAILATACSVRTSRQGLD